MCFKYFVTVQKLNLEALEACSCSQELTGFQLLQECPFGMRHQWQNHGLVSQYLNYTKYL